MHLTIHRPFVIGMMIILCAATHGSAQDNRYVSVATQVSVGGANVLDTYLSPEKYRGAEYRFVSEVDRDSRKHDGITYNLTHEGAFAYLHNRAVTAHEYVGHYDFSYAVMRRWRLADDRLQLAAGVMADAFVGFNYNNRNFNNRLLPKKQLSGVTSMKLVNSRQLFFIFPLLIFSYSNVYAVCLQLFTYSAYVGLAVMVGE